MTQRITGVPLLDLKGQYDSIRADVDAAIARVLESQHFILGPEVEALETAVAEYSQCRYGIGVSSGSDALLVALMALDIKPGDEVITTPFSFFATAGCAARLGAKPVFVDIEPSTFNIDAQKIEAAITSRTKAIIPVHLYGQMADMDTIMDVASRHGVAVIEDAAQAIGADYRGRRAGSIGAMGCLSFFPSKNLGAYGDAGMVVTNDESLAQRLKMLRAHGAQPKYYHRLLGGNFRIDALQAAILHAKFKYLEGWTSARQHNANRYRKLFAEAGAPAELVMPAETGFGRHIYHQFVIRSSKRDTLQAHLKSRGIGTEVYYPLPLHLQDCFEDLNYHPGDFMHSERASLESLALPIYPELTEDQQKYVIDAVMEFYAAS